MRPRRLELEGFTAFRESVVVDFDDVDLFALTGATGAGKSSVIDALIFVLFGSVPRYDDVRLVHPVISQGKLEAKVRLDFSVDGRDYTAVRVVRRTKKGATTKEARLESGDETLAGNTDELTAAAERILGLTFKQFTTCVVLPQGDFASFLHEKPSKRQELLVRLLGLGLYSRMAAAAKMRESGARQRATLYEEQLTGLSHATSSAKKEAKRRHEDLQLLRSSLEEARPELDRLKQEADTQTQLAQDLSTEAQLLESLATPKGVEVLERELIQCRDRTSKGKQALDAAEKTRRDAEEARQELGDAESLRSLERYYVQKTESERQLKSERESAKSAVTAAEEAAKQLQSAQDELTSAREALEAARRLHSAHDLAAHLKPGERCPVCLRQVDELPPHERPPTLDTAAKHVKTAEKAKRAAQQVHRAADNKRSAIESTVDSIAEKVRELKKKLRNRPDEQAIKSQLAAIAEADKDLAKARKEEDSSRVAYRKAEQALANLQPKVSDAWRAFDASRDALARLEPPQPDRDDLPESWRALVGWADELAPKQRLAAEDAKAAASKAETDLMSRLSAFEDACAKLEVEIGERAVWDTVVEAAADARTKLEQIEADLKKARKLKSDRKQALDAAKVAGTLARHLRANAFERWLLETVFERLVEAASVVLEQLSSGEYSFAYDERLNFEVVDHRNADERRSAKTLSGGETFLASLALALTLAEQVAELAAHGSARIESIFLDEGFGSLDPNTLDTVTAAIEELGSRGRMVGLVTHVPELADRVPVQFRVTKGPATSTVEKILS